MKVPTKYAGTPTKKPSCTVLRSVLGQTDWTFDNQIRKLSGGPPPPTSALAPTTRDVAPTEAPPSETKSGTTGDIPALASAMSSQQPLLDLEDGTILVEWTGNFAGPPPPVTAASSHVDSPTASSSSSISSS